ncbi:MAG: BON domain-containing protein [Hyphomonas sp.]|uniref:BON domain-containing protein n=1 Tax=Hyphomonas sp. TaxID=87 RepID=UPI00182E3E28|nr:BON domain-containing protein [Hyphomonas sp.]MBA3068518.1 BON domain-containing protein [Hyphomonas sp.]MBU3920538.1 BON domain-containing protein [Alphaproteobacteria bacterium]MBU4060614.1 BON domain-containing protein [Alphaproteobacteria bacterium]MBU4164598.1 BON domain-containing protein [Alphaproteobacteria bacterium]
MRIVLALPCLLAVMSMTGCAVAVLGAAGAVGLTTMQEKTMGEALDDATASNEIKAKLLNESGAKYAEVDVEVANGLVLLSGRVNEPADRTYAEGIAWSSSRARDVANEIRIEPPGGFMANVSDEIITGRVRARLIGSSKVKSVNFNIETYDGVVYLMGIARSTDELRRAAEEASVVGGVKQVVSYVRVREAVNRTAAPVTTEAPPPAPYQPAPDASYTTEPMPELHGANYETGSR